MLQQLQLSVGALRQDGSGKGLHDLLDRHWLLGELVLRGTANGSVCDGTVQQVGIISPDQTKGTHSDRLQICVSVCRSIIRASCAAIVGAVPACDLKGRAKNLS